MCVGVVSLLLRRNPRPSSSSFDFFAAFMAACLLTGPLGLSPGIIAAALIFIMQLGGLFQYMVRLSAELALEF